LNTILYKVPLIIKNNSKSKNNFELEEIKFSILPPLSVYIHFPWCEKKCPYCDFNSHDANTIDEENYLIALEYDLIATLPLIWGRRIYSVFIGGGTPSLISVNGMKKIMQMLNNLLPMHTCQEITMEANPGSTDSEKFQAFADLGINRISLGIQSFNDKHLKSLGRIHNNYQAQNAIEIAQKYFSNINLDLMFALPEQTLNQCLEDLSKAISFDTNHLSYYHLTLEPNTYFAKYPPNIPDNDSAFDMHDLVIQTLDNNNYNRYEISAYSKKNYESKHNLNYWNFGDYIGIGAGAHGKISFSDKIIRYVKHKHPKTYISQAINLIDAQKGRHIIEEKRLTAKELPFEYMLNSLRLINGSSIQNFISNTSLGYHYIDEQINLAQQKNLLEVKNNIIRPSKLGLCFLNDLQMLFL